MNYDFSGFHKGHNLATATHGGLLHIVCLDCGVAAELEGISAKCSVTDAYKSAAEAAITPRAAFGKVSVGVKR